MKSSDSDEEYLDDPIQLIDFEPKGITSAVENCKSVNTNPDFEVTDSDGDLYIEKNNNIFKKSLPRFKKVPITLPVTFFDISRNVELLNRCKLLSVKVVNCVEYPWYYKKYSKAKDDNTMTVEGSKIKIRPVTSPYRNLKCDNSKKTPEKKESNPSEWRDSKQKNQNSMETAREDSQVDFKKNHGLIGMKITQTHVLPIKTAQEKTKKKHEKLNNKTRKVNTSTDKKTNDTCETKSISTSNQVVTTLKDSNDIVSKKCAESKEVNNTIGAFKIQAVNKCAKVADTWKIVSSKVESDKVVSHTNDLGTKLKLAKVSKIREVNDILREVFQNDSKTLVNNNKCDDTKKDEQAKGKLVTSRGDDSNDKVQSIIFNENHNAQKTKSTTHKVKRESKSINANLIGCKIKMPDSISTNDPDDLLAVSLEATNKTTGTEIMIENKEICKKIYNNSVKMTDTEKSFSKHENTTGNKNILNMTLVKPTKNTTKTGEFSKTSQSKNQKLNCSPKSVIANLIKEQNKNEGQLSFLPTKLNSNTDLKESTISKNKKKVNQLVKTAGLVKDNGALNDSVQNTKTNNPVLIRNSNDNSVQNKQATNPVLVKDGGILAKSVQNTKVSDCQVNPCDMKKIERQTINNSNTNDINRKIDESNKIKPNTVDVQEHPKNIEPTSQQNLCDVFKSKHSSKQICTSLENVRWFKNEIEKKNMLVSNVKDKQWMATNELTNNDPVPNHPSINNPTLVKQINPRNLDIIDLTNNCNPVQQQLPKNINSNSELTRSSATNATPINEINFKTCSSGASIETRVTTDSRAPPFTQVRDQPPAFTNVNTVTQPYDCQIPLDIPPDAKRYPRVIKISKRHPETTESIMNTCNNFNGNHLLQLAHNSFDKIPFGQPFNNVNKNLIQEQACLPAYENKRENVPKQQPLPLQQNSGATNSQMLANYHAAAQKIARPPSVSQSLMLNNQNVINTHTTEQASHQLPSLITQQNKSQITPNNVQSQEKNILTPDQLYKMAHEMLPPTGDVAVIETLRPCHDLNTKNIEHQPRQLSKTNLPRIILRNPVTKRQIQQTHLSNQSVVRPHQVPHYLYPSNFGYNAPPNMQPNVPYSRGFEQVHSDINQLPPQNYIHCAPKYDGLPKNMIVLNSAPYDNYWNNHYPVTLPPPPPPPPPYPKPIQPQQQIKPSTSQTCASYNQPNNSAAKSVTGTTVIGCNNAGPVRKINILGEPTGGTSSNSPANTQRPPLKPFQSVRETVNNTNNSSIKLTDTTDNGHAKKSPVGVQNSVKQIQDINHTVSSKREMLEELSKLTTIESSSKRPVNEFKTPLRPSPKPDAIQDKAKVPNNSLTESNTKRGEGNFIKSALPKIDIIKQSANSFNEPLPKSDIKQAEGNLIKHPLHKPDVKQQDANLFMKPLPKSSEKPDEGNLAKRPKLDANQEKPNSLKRTLPEQKETNLIQRSKPGPLSKKLKLNSTTPPTKTAATLEASVVHKGYSPPILPIPTYQKSLELLARSNIGDSILSLSTINQTEYDSADVRGERRYSSDKQEKLSKKISLDEYKKRCQEEVKVGELNVNKIKIEIKSESPEQDLGYVSDSTTKL